MLRRVPDMNAHGRGRSVLIHLPEDDRRARFRTVYDTNYHRVLGYLLRRTASREDAEDLLAETFLAAWRRLEEVPLADARPWLYSVARNMLANHLRGERRRGRIAGRLAATASSPLQAHAEGDVAWVAVAFARLREEDRELLALAAWEELDPGEIATVLGCSRNAARIRLHRARRRWTREVQDTEVDTTRWSLIHVETEQGMREPR
jgi:RNA polymerase sigma factor (sigma-70 family)